MLKSNYISVGDICCTDYFNTDVLAFYEIVDTGQSNGKDILATDNGNFAKLLSGQMVTPELLGSYSDGVHDDSDVIDYFISNYDAVFNNKEYYINKPINVSKSIQGTDTVFKLGDNGYLVIDSLKPQSVISNLYINGSSKCMELKNTRNVYFNKVRFKGTGDIASDFGTDSNTVCCDTDNCWTIDFTDCYFYNFDVVFNCTHNTGSISLETSSFNSCYFGFINKVVNNVGFNNNAIIGGNIENCKTFYSVIKTNDNVPVYPNRFIGCDIENVSNLYEIDPLTYSTYMQYERIVDCTIERCNIIYVHQSEGTKYTYANFDFTGTTIERCKIVNDNSTRLYLGVNNLIQMQYLTEPVNDNVFIVQSLYTYSKKQIDVTSLLNNFGTYSYLDLSDLGTIESVALEGEIEKTEVSSFLNKYRKVTKTDKNIVLTAQSNVKLTIKGTVTSAIATLLVTAI